MWRILKIYLLVAIILALQEFWAIYSWWTGFQTIGRVIILEGGEAIEGEELQ